MPISRVMNNPDGSTPVPPVGGGDINGTLASSILWQHAGTAASQIAVPTHLVAQTTTMGIPSVTPRGPGAEETLPPEDEPGEDQAKVV